MKKAFVAAAIAALNMQAFAAKQDCENAAHAKAYVSGFQKEFMAAGTAMTDREKEYTKRIDAIKARLINAGAWTPQEASLQVTNFAILDQEAKEAEAVRKKAATDLKVQLYALEGVDIVAGNDKVARDRAACLMGYDAIDKLQKLDGAASAAWELLIAKLAKVAAEKNISLD